MKQDLLVIIGICLGIACCLVLSSCATVGAGLQGIGQGMGASAKAQQAQTNQTQFCQVHTYGSISSVSCQ